VTNPRFVLTVSGILLLCLAGSVRGQSEAAPEAESPEAAVPEAPPGETVSLPTVEVTARKWVEVPLNVPQSITVIPESLIRDAGLRSIREASIYVPNLNVVEFSSRRLSFPFVRGIGSGQGEPAVTTTIDGVPLFFGGGANFPLLNVERIEFLRGPQGTLYGRNALGGMIHVITRKPPAAPTFHLDGTLGNYNLREMRFLLGAPLVEDRLSASLAGLHHRRDGYTRNDYTGHFVDDRNTFFGQAQFLWTPDERNEIRFCILGERSRDGGFVLSDLEGLRERPRRVFQDFEGVTERDVLLPAITWTHRGDAVDFISISSYEHQEVLGTSDFDFSALDGVRRRSEQSLGAFLQEFRVSSAVDHPLELSEEARVKWLAGAVYFRADSDRSGANEYRPGGVGIISPVAGTDTSRGDFKDRGLALFGQATVTLFEDLDVGAGLRFDYEKKDASLSRSFVSGGIPFSSTSRDLDEDYSEILPRFDLAYRVSSEVTVYGLAARGFKAGGFNLDAPSGLIPYSPETSWTYEAGVKTSLLDSRLRFNAACFLIDWDDMQLSQFDAQVGGYVTNAGKSTSRGLEFELAGRPLDDLDLFATFGYTDAEFDSYVDPYGVDVSGNALPFAPKTTFSAGAQWSGDLSARVRFTVRAEYAAVGSFYYDPGNRESEQYSLANFRVGLAGESWRLDVWLRNAFANDYVPVAFQPSPADPSIFVGESGAPRTFGVTLSLTF